jgi:hypothetical protein
MRIFAKQTFALGQGLIKNTDKIEYIYTIPLSFMDVPDSVSEDATFKLAVKAGLIMVVDSAAVKQEIEKKVQDNSFDDGEPDEEPSEIDALISELKAMSKEEALAKATELNVSLTGDEKAKDIKKKILNQVKMNLADKEAE